MMNKIKNGTLKKADFYFELATAGDMEENYLLMNNDYICSLTANEFGRLK